MAYEKLKRSRYYDPPSEYPHSSRHHAEDMLEFHLPLMRMANAHVHDWGVADGLEVSGIAGDAQVVVEGGVALAGDGRLIALSPAGHGDIGANPLAPSPQSIEVTVPVGISLASFAGQTVYLTIRYSEILRPAEGSGGRLEQVPWLRLQPGAGPDAYVDDGNTVILAVVRVTGAGTLDWLKPRDASMTYARRVLGQRLSTVRVSRSYNAPAVDETTAGTIQAGDGGGLAIRVPAGGDNITLARDGDLNFASLIARANSMLVKDSAGRDVLGVSSSSGTVTIGSNGREGNVTVKDSSGRNVVTIDGNSAALYLGVSGNEGDLIVRDGGGSQTARVDGNTGTVFSKRLAPQVNNVIDVDARFFRIHGWDLCLDGRSGGNKRALVDWNQKLVINFANDYANGVETPGSLDVWGQLRAGGRILASNPARHVAAVWLFADNGTDTEEVDLGSARQVFAFVAMTGCDPRHDFDRGDAFALDIFRVDGNKTGPWVTGGDHWGGAGADSNVYAQTYWGTASRLTFRARSTQNATVHGIGIVFHE